MGRCAHRPCCPWFAFLHVRLTKPPQIAMSLRVGPSPGPQRACGLRPSPSCGDWCRFRAAGCGSEVHSTCGRAQLERARHVRLLVCAHEKTRFLFKKGGLGTGARPRTPERLPRRGCELGKRPRAPSRAGALGAQSPPPAGPEALRFRPRPHFLNANGRIWCSLALLEGAASLQAPASLPPRRGAVMSRAGPPVAACGRRARWRPADARLRGGGASAAVPAACIAPAPPVVKTGVHWREESRKTFLRGQNRPSLEANWPVSPGDPPLRPSSSSGLPAKPQFRGSPLDAWSKSAFSVPTVKAGFDHGGRLPVQGSFRWRASGRARRGCRLPAAGEPRERGARPRRGSAHVGGSRVRAHFLRFVASLLDTFAILWGIRRPSAPRFRRARPAASARPAVSPTRTLAAP